MPLSHLAFPDYTRSERRVDGIVHILGLVAAPLAIIWLFVEAGSAITVGRVITAGVYCFGLIGMLAASALYNAAADGRGKSLLRRLDHAMIFVMIAGTYTPLSITVLRPGLGIPLCVIAWSLAAVGITLELARPQRHRRIALALYLGMGWLLTPVLPPLIAALQPGVLTLIVAGALVYSFGSFIQTRVTWPFHNAIWHALVLIAAGLHLVAIEQIIAFRA